MEAVPLSCTNNGGSDNSWIFRTGWTPQSESLSRNNCYAIGDLVDSQAR
ncbi:hypothetical protein RO3G_11106 [Rhizopus delemar RA 99-880]|uniref:Uncharacterized protein n=1 Tax=Rhizopus delemar (strain RA 99-880 / ATCC MYA-4621 / FGSC 9543 / NRRL 43880) TaxID=246409 RepID=I1CD65_RHIO9|nr:hypothetical protein RO3G_11106 [Rhizopus delemar RA 99-880]|eukprot:EIE86395.1 hypothetical protein RO3G_11106 [Rhizopus delemar RA 99-880]